MPETEQRRPFYQVDTRVIDVSERLAQHVRRDTPDWHTIDDAAGPPMGFRAAIPQTTLLPRHRPTVIMLDGHTTDEMAAISPSASPAVEAIEDDDLNSDDLELVEEEIADDLVTSSFMRRSLEWLERQPVSRLRIAIAVGVVANIILLDVIIVLLSLPVS